MATDAVPEFSYRWWINQLDKDEKRLKTGFWDDGEKIVKKFKGKKGSEGQDQYLLNLFWANVRVMRASIYGKKPKPMVVRAWGDADDAVGRVASMMLQRCLSADLEKNKSPMDSAIRLAVDDWLVPGLGMVWFRYYAETEQHDIYGSGSKVDVVQEEEVCCDYVHWRDLVYPAARVEDEVWYLGRKCYLTPEDIKEKFGFTVSEDDEDKVPDDSNRFPKNFTEDKVCIYELWCKRNRKIYWVCREIPDFCKSKDDIYGLEDFYPAPMPLMANLTNDDYLPRADYMMMRDQYDQINELNTRIVLLEKALRVVGVYDKKNAEVARILSEARENDMIAVDKWAVLAEGGGLKGVVDWFPVDVIAETLDKLREQKAEKKQEIYELSGISDIMRGASNPRETLGAQKLKAQFGSVSLDSRQDQVARFVRRALAIKAELICKFFQPQTIARMSNIMFTPDAQMAEPAIQLMKDTEMVHYRVDINEETLALPDYQLEQQNRMEFLTTVGQFLSQSAQVLEYVPNALPTLLQMIRWVSAGFKGSNEIQGVLDQAFRQASQPGAVRNPNQDSSQPEDVVGAEQAKAQGALQLEQVKQSGKMQEIKFTKDLELRNLLEVEQLKQQGSVHEMLGEQILGQQEHQQEMQAAQQDHAHALQTNDQAHQQNLQAQQHDHMHQDQMTQEQLAHEDATTQQAQQHEEHMAGVQHQNSMQEGKQSGDVQLAVSKLRKPTGNGSKNK